MKKNKIHKLQRIKRHVGLAFIIGVDIARSPFHAECFNPVLMPNPFSKSTAEIMPPLKSYFCVNGTICGFPPCPHSQMELACFLPSASRAALTGWSLRMSAVLRIKALISSAQSPRGRKGAMVCRECRAAAWFGEIRRHDATPANDDTPRPDKTDIAANLVFC